MDIPIF